MTALLYIALIVVSVFAWHTNNQKKKLEANIIAYHEKLKKYALDTGVKDSALYQYVISNAKGLLSKNASNSNVHNDYSYVSELANSGSKPKAIALYRQMTGTSLKEAKKDVDSMIVPSKHS